MILVSFLFQKKINKNRQHIWIVLKVLKTPSPLFFVDTRYMKKAAGMGSAMRVLSLQRTSQECLSLKEALYGLSPKKMIIGLSASITFEILN